MFVHKSENCLEEFVKEARRLALLKHPSIVRVLDVFNAHNTAYMVMEYEPGQNIANFIKDGGIVTEEELMGFFPALLDGLEAVHKAGYLHRDIKPANIYLRQTDYSPILIDFGSARYDLGSRSHSITTIITPGYAQFEQYQDDRDKEGPWTDIYAFAAILYRLINGEAPPEATERFAALTQSQPDPLKPAAQIGQGQYPQHFLEAIDWALALSEQDRPQSIEAWRDELFAKPSLETDEAFTMPLDIDDSPNKPIEHSKKTLEIPPPRDQPRGFAMGIGVVILFALILGGSWLFYSQSKPDYQTEAEPARGEDSMVTTTLVTLTTDESEATVEANLRTIAMEKAAAAEADIPSGPLRIMTGAGVRLRQQPRQNAKRGEILPIGTIVSELEQINNWYRVKTSNDEMGWVHSKYSMSFISDKRAQAYIEVAKRKLNSRKTSFGDVVDLCNFLNRANEEVELEVAVELKLLYLLALQRSLDKIPSSQQYEAPYAEWLNRHRAKIVHRGDGWIVKRKQFQQLHDKYSFMPIAERIMQLAPY